MQVYVVLLCVACGGILGNSVRLWIQGEEEWQTVERNGDLLGRWCLAFVATCC
jgi:hypothetical protein